MSDSIYARPKGVHLSDEEMSRVMGAESGAMRSPIPTQIISNGEYNPPPQTPKQKQVEGLINEYADKYGRKMGMDRRKFLTTTCGMAAAFLAMNKVYGPVFDVTEAEAADREMSDERAKLLSGQFIFDDQTHFVRDEFDKEGLLGLGDYASKNWNPAMIDEKKGGVPLTLARYKFQNYMKEIFLDSDTKVALLSGAPFDDPSWWLLSNDQIAGARAAVNKIAGTRRLFSHFVFTPNYPNWVEEVDRAIAELKPDGWKGYTVGDPLSPSQKGTQWRLDDEKMMYPVYEKMQKSGIRNICLHKGLLPKDYEKSWKEVWQYNTPWDLAKAAKDWPGLNFIIYHTALRPFTEQPDTELAEFEKSGYIQWSTDVAKLVSEQGLKNVYGEIGTSFANSAVANPRFAAAFIGQLVNLMGVDNVVWGTDSVWYGSPQWQIEAMRRLEIPDDMMAKTKWKTKLGDADSAVKRKVFGQNSARLYKFNAQAEFDNISRDQIAMMKQEYEKEGVERNNAFYGFVPKPA
jgi:predicted TIM-barrel fold metal-dependent hydrolase